MHRHLAAILTLLFPILAGAQTLPPVPMQTAQVRVKLSTGTGFFINREGDIVTNAHVVQGCQSITVHTGAGDQPATLIAQDKERDLAVLRSVGQVPDTASLRWNTADLAVGETVIVMGYPGSEGVSNRYSFRKTALTALTGPGGEAQWLQFGDVAEHGNSGGPVLDTAGNVVAVVVGKSKTYRKLLSQPSSTPELLGQASVAIALPALQEFLHAHSIGYGQAPYGATALADADIERRGNRFIVPIRCVLGRSQ